MTVTRIIWQMKRARGGEDAIETLLAAVHQRYNEPLTLDALARSVYMTPSYVSFLFRQRTGTTLIKYITEYRLSRAEEMLRQGGKSVTGGRAARGL